MTRRISRRTMMAAAALLGSAAFFGGAEAQDKPTFALVQINQQALFFNQMNEGAQKAADEAGAELVIFNANDDPAAQNDAIETYIQQKGRRHRRRRDRRERRHAGRGGRPTRPASRSSPSTRSCRRDRRRRRSASTTRRPAR